MRVKVTSFDVVDEPGFLTATLSQKMISTKIIKYFSNEYCHNYNGRGIIKKLPIGAGVYMTRCLINVIEYERKKKYDGHRFDVLIVDSSRVISNQSLDDFFYHYKNETVNRVRREIILDDCNIEFVTTQDLRHRKNYLYPYTRDSVDLVIFNIPYHNKMSDFGFLFDSNNVRRNGEPLIKFILLSLSDTTFDIRCDNLYMEDMNNWTDELYKNSIRVDKLERILKNDYYE